MSTNEHTAQAQKKNQPPVKQRFIAFSLVLFFIISIVGSGFFVISMRQIIRNNKGNELSQLLKIETMKLETLVSNEIVIALQLAESPLLIRYFTDPVGSSELKPILFDEIGAYRHSFASDSVFWVNDTDKLFYSDDSEPYLIDETQPENYWYPMTLNETEQYNFNINYNPALNVTNLWINVPVFDNNRKPLGILGTGINLTSFIDLIYMNYAGQPELYFFNASGEITGAADIDLVTSKTNIVSLFGDTGAIIFQKAQDLRDNEIMTLDTPLGKVALGDVPSLEWVILSVSPNSIHDYNTAMTWLFVAVILVIAISFVVFNVFIAGLLKPLRRTMQSLEIASRAKSDFLADMSHEIRTPLNAILGITEIQLQSATLDTTTRDAMDRIYVSGDLLLGIINDILDLSKIEIGKLELLVGRYEVASLINDTAQLNMMRIGSKPIEFELHVDSRLPAALLGDELRVKQILNNILSNAFKYTAAGSVKMTVSVEADLTADDAGGDVGMVDLVVSVSDTGQGMTQEYIDRIFEKYSRFNMEANRSTEGTGLGMSITRNLLDLMHGAIAVESELGKGSTITIRIPQGRCGQEVLGEKLAENLQRFRANGMTQLKRVQISRESMPYGRVLVVDDVETNIYVATGLLAPYNLKIDSAESGYAAIEMIKKGNTYDIVFMDHMMPKMDGIEATKILREMGYEGSIVALTANAVVGQAELFLTNGFTEFMSKPIDIRQLNSVLNKLIRDKQPAEAISAARRQLADIADIADTADTADIKGQPSQSAQPSIDPKLAEIFVRDAVKSLGMLEAIVQKETPYNEADLRTYVIYIHGIKSALANIGFTDLSAIARELEISGRKGDSDALSAETPAFLASLRKAVEDLSVQKEDVEAETDDEISEDDSAYLHEKLLMVKDACDNYDKKAARAAITELKGRTWPKETREFLETISEYLLHSDFDDIAQAVEGLLAER